MPAVLPTGFPRFVDQVVPMLSESKHIGAVEDSRALAAQYRRHIRSAYD